MHLAQSTPAPLRRATWLCFDRLTVDPIGCGVTNDRGWAVAPDGPGIGAEPDPDRLGEPFAVYQLDEP
jgi:L-alanine-DL-glutamate epimerase-like enolase superfamily enzyme